MPAVAADLAHGILVPPRVWAPNRARWRDRQGPGGAVHQQSPLDLVSKWNCHLASEMPWRLADRIKRSVPSDNERIGQTWAGPICAVAMNKSVHGARPAKLWVRPAFKEATKTVHLQVRIVTATLLLAALAIGTGTVLLLGYLLAAFSIGAIIFIMTRKMVKRMANVRDDSLRLVPRSSAVTSRTNNENPRLAAWPAGSPTSTCYIAVGDGASSSSSLLRLGLASSPCWSSSSSSQDPSREEQSIELSAGSFPRDAPQLDAAMTPAPG